MATRDTTLGQNKTVQTRKAPVWQSKPPDQRETQNQVVVSSEGEGEMELDQEPIPTRVGPDTPPNLKRQSKLPLSSSSYGYDTPSGQCSPHHGYVKFMGARDCDEQPLPSIREDSPPGIEEL